MVRTGWKIVGAACLSLVIALLVGGCSNSDDATTRDKAPPPSAGAQPERPNPDKIKTLPGARKVIK